jgi:hypothetical protein
MGAERTCRVAVAGKQNDWIECVHSFPDIPFSPKGDVLPQYYVYLMNAKWRFIINVECGVLRFPVIVLSSRQMFAVAQGQLLSQFWGGPGVPSVTKDMNMPIVQKIE